MSKIATARSYANDLLDVSIITPEYGNSFAGASSNFLSPKAGTAVYMAGAVSGITHGTVSRTGLTLNIEGTVFRKLAEADYRCDYGDSGAAIFASDTSFSR